MSKKTPGPATAAFAALDRAGISYRSHSYEHNSRAESYGLEAAELLNIDPNRVFKTLMIDVDGVLCVAVVPVAATLDLKAAAQSLGGKKAQMANPAAAQRATGYVLGGISPLGQKKLHRTLIDESAAGYSTIFVSAGRRGLEAELAPADLVRLTQASLTAIARR